ncbi:hypothetical protein [Bartonella sp. AU15XJBT]|uniref:hypothetical protein n=1 Tax=Bartonella sp. AU15XJBT TaxID=3019087 RepID=UPI00236269E2|nr:hypothetical protein [Bartonella sp. AU15XJBT]
MTELDLSFISGKDGGTQWLYHNTIHGFCCEKGLGGLRNFSLKKPMNAQSNGILSYRIPMC